MGPSSIGKRITRARERAGFSQRDLCKKAGLSNSVVEQIESGAIQSPRAQVLVALADALDTTVAWLTYGTTASTGRMK